MKGDRTPLDVQAANRREGNRRWHERMRAKGRCPFCQQTHTCKTVWCRRCRLAISELRRQVHQSDAQRAEAVNGPLAHGRPRMRR